MFEKTVIGSLLVFIMLLIGMEIFVVLHEDEKPHKIVQIFYDITYQPSLQMALTLLYGIVMYCIGRKHK